MGVDYDAVGGIGVEVTEVVWKFIESGLFTQEDWDYDVEECLDKVGIAYENGGNHYSGDTTYYYLVEGSNLTEVKANSVTFLNKLNEYGLELTEADLKVISEICIW